MMKICSSTFLIAILVITIGTTCLVSSTPTNPVTQSVDTWPRYQLATSTPNDIKNPMNLRVVDLATSSMKANEHLVIEGRYNPALMTTGWHFLQIDTTTGLVAKNAAAAAASSSSSIYDAQTEFYLAGFLEGYLTYLPIKQKNTTGFWNASTTNDGVRTWVLDQIDWMQTQSNAKASADVYWNRVSAILQQLQGCADGYNQAAKNQNVNQETDSITFFDVFAQSFQESFGDVLAHVQQVKSFKETGRYPTEYSDWSKPKNRHCSSSIVATKSDFYLSHVSWNYAETMLRVYKIYNFINVTVSMSSYPAIFFSLDDFYETSYGLAIFETSLVVWNLTMYNVFPSSTVSQFIRAMVANYLATDAVEWPAQFIKLNDGTYNNEYACVDYKKANASSVGGPNGSSFAWLAALPPNTVTFIDQLPGFYRTVDATNLIKQNRYFASYNIPNDFAAYEISENQLQPQPFWAFNYTTSQYARPKIFKELAPKVETMADMQIMMRWNKFKTDPNSLIMNCAGTPGGVCDPKYSAMLAIACRGDLNPPGGNTSYGPNWPYLGQRNHEGIDAKISAYSFWATARTPAEFPLKSLIISGPTNDNQPTYKFSTVPIPFWKWKHHPPAGMPDEWNFPWIQVQATSGDDGSNDSSDATGKALGYAFGVIGIIVLISVIWLIVKNNKQEEDEQNKNNGGGAYEAVESTVQ